MTKRVCYIHVGPHKSGTTSIQWFLQENRAELLEQGYFVPESETKRGAHHGLVQALAGLELGEHREAPIAHCIREIAQTTANAVIISSEALEGILRNRNHTKVFFSRIEALNLEPKLILFPRNQAQWINSSYASSVKSFRRSDSFQPGVLRFAQSPDATFSRWIELAAAHNAELIAQPFSNETLRRGVIPEFLRCVSITSSKFRDRAVRRNEAAGPFTVSVAREVLRSIGKPLTWLQTRRCKVALAKYCHRNRIVDTRYCGLTTAMAKDVENRLRSDNDAFAQRVWSRSWAEVFADDVAEEFRPNDFELRAPDWFTARRIRRAIRLMKIMADEILQDRELSVKAPWNDVAHRSGLVSRNWVVDDAQPHLKG